MIIERLTPGSPRLQACTAVLFPGACGVVCLALDIALVVAKSSGAVPVIVRDDG